MRESTWANIGPQSNGMDYLVPMRLEAESLQKSIYLQYLLNSNNNYQAFIPVAS